MSIPSKRSKDFEFCPSGVLSLLPANLEFSHEGELAPVTSGHIESGIGSPCLADALSSAPDWVPPQTINSAEVTTDADQSLQDDILIALRQIMRAIDLKSRSLLQEFGLTGPQLVCLNTIAQRQPLTTGGLAKAVHLAHPTVTGIVNRLEQRGWIARMRSESDRRNVELRLTESGKTVVERAPPPLPGKFKFELSKLEIWERTQILATLQRIACMLDATEIDLAPLLAAESDIADLG